MGATIIFHSYLVLFVYIDYCLRTNKTCW